MSKELEHLEGLGSAKLPHGKGLEIPRNSTQPSIGIEVPPPLTGKGLVSAESKYLQHGVEGSLAALTL